MSEGPADNDPVETSGSGDRTDDGNRQATLPVPEPSTDDVVVELVRDAVGVARGELSDRRFSRKYGTGADDEDREPDG